MSFESFNPSTNPAPFALQAFVLAIIAVFITRGKFPADREFRNKVGEGVSSIVINFLLPLLVVDTLVNN